MIDKRDGEGIRVVPVVVDLGVDQGHSGEAVSKIHTFSVRIPEGLHDAARVCAAVSRQSVNEWVVIAIRQRCERERGEVKRFAEAFNDARTAPLRCYQCRATRCHKCEGDGCQCRCPKPGEQDKP